MSLQNEHLRQEHVKKQLTAYIKIIVCWGIIKLVLTISIGIFMLPSFLCAQESTQTYNRESIRYPSMTTGQVWAKIGKDSFSDPRQESQLMKNDIPQGGETKVIKKTTPKTSRPAYKKENQNQKASTNKSIPIKKIHVAKGTTSEAPKADEYGNNRQLKQELHTSEMQKSSLPKKNWHHKQELYDVDCGEKLARVVFTYYFDKQERLLGSSPTHDAKWQHIYPGSFEEQLYTEICHPR
jgi:hypothetical protein